MPLSPIKLLTSKFKSPPISHSNRFSGTHHSSSSGQRSRSYDPTRRPSREEYATSSSRRASYARPRSPDPYRSSRPSRHERHSRRRDSSESSPEPRYSRPPPRDRDEYLSTERLEDARGRRRASLAPPERDERPPLSGNRPSSVDYRRSSHSRHNSTSGGGYRHESREDPRVYDRRPSIPGKYRPDRYGDVDSPPVSPGRRESLRSPRVPLDDTPPRSSRPHASPRPSETRPYEYRPYEPRHEQRPHEAKSQSPRPQLQRTESKQPPSSSSSLFASMPAAVAAYAGLKEVSKHADTAKEWIDWLNEMSETPEEIQELSAQAATARDTINQVQLTLKARPDLVEGEQGEKLKGQIETSVKSTDKALEKMTKLLAEISTEGTSAQGQTAIDQMQGFWRSYRYKNDFEQQVKKAQEDVQKELSALSTLMVNIYSRALMKPGPPGASPIPPPAPTPAAPSPAPAVSQTNTAPAAQPPPSSPPPPPPTATTASAAATAQTPLASTAAHTIHPPVVQATGARPNVDVNAPPVPKISEPVPASPQVAQAASSLAGSRTDASANASSHLPQSPLPGVNEKATAGPPPQHTPAAAPHSTQPATQPSAPASAAKVDTTAAQAPTAVDPRRLSQSQSPRQQSQSPHPSSHRNSIHSNHSAQEAEDRLLDAAWDGDIDATAHALRHASPRTCDDQGLTALHLAADRDRLAVALLLLDRGADINARSNGGRTPLHLAARSATAPTVEMLLERGRADPNAQTSKGRTPLHYAASKAEDGDEERREVLRVLRDWGADPTIKDTEGATARDVAQKRGHWDAMSTLRRAERRWEEDHRPGWMQRHGFKK